MLDRLCLGRFGCGRASALGGGGAGSSSSGAASATAANVGAAGLACASGWAGAGSITAGTGAWTTMTGCGLGHKVRNTMEPLISTAQPMAASTTRRWLQTGTEGGTVTGLGAGRDIGSPMPIAKPAGLLPRGLEADGASGASGRSGTGGGSGSRSSWGGGGAMTAGWAMARRIAIRSPAREISTCSRCWRRLNRLLTNSARCAVFQKYWPVACLSALANSVASGKRRPRSGPKACKSS